MLTTSAHEQGGAAANNDVGAAAPKQLVPTPVIPDSRWGGAKGRSSNPELKKTELRFHNHPSKK